MPITVIIAILLQFLLKFYLSFYFSAFSKEFTYHCDHCNFNGQIRDIFRHYQEKHPESEYDISCIECDYKLDLKNLKKFQIKNYWSHILKHHSERKDFICPHCGKFKLK